MTIPRALLSRHMAVAILLLGIGSLSTQAFAIATGRDFLFGLIPKFNPAGPRNIPVWFASATLAASAVWVACAAAMLRASRHQSARAWWGLALALALLSAERMATLNRGIQQMLAAFDAHAVGYAASLIAVAAALAIFGRCVADVPKASRPHFLLAAAVFGMGAVVCYTASAGTLPPEDRLSGAFLMSAGRVLELSGLTLLMSAVVTRIRALAPRVVVTLDSTGPLVVDAHREGNLLDLRISPRRIASILLAVTAILLLASLGSGVLRTLLGWEIEGIYRLLGVDFEGNLPTWFSSLLLLACAAVIGATAAAKHHQGAVEWRHWALLAVAFVALSADEAASFHELTVVPLRSLLRDNPWLRYPLIVPGTIATLGAVVVFRGFVRALPVATRNGAIAGAGLFLFGALVVETVGGWFDPLVVGPNLTYLLLATFEEGCEMSGGVILLWTMMRHIERFVGRLDLPNATRSRADA